MRQLPERMYDDGLERSLTSRIDDLETRLGDRITILESPGFETTTYEAPPNYLPNSYPEWSTLAYGTAGTTPATAGDTNYEAYNWFEQTSATTDLSGATALVGSGHSTYAGLGTDVPRWDRTNGFFLLGSSTTNYDICCPLPTDFVMPGQRFFVYLEAAYTQSDTDDNNTEFYCGFWDNTLGQRKWIEGTDFTPTVSVYGAGGGRTLEYKVMAETDSGDQILSAAVSTATAPSTLTTSNHVRISFSGAPGFIRFVVYRKDGSNYYRVADIRNTIDLQFYDMVESGDTVVPVGGYPSVTGNRPQAYASTIDFNPAAPGSVNAHLLTIQVPTTYDRSNTGNHQQYFRFGLSSLVAAGSEHEIAIRRISVSEGYGAWTRCPRDLQAASGPSLSAASAPTPGGGTSGGPETGGSGRQACLTMDMIVPTEDGDKPIGLLSISDRVVIGPMSLPIKSIKDGTVQFVWEIELESGEVVRCSDTHRLITSKRDRRGVAAARLKVGDSLLTQDFVESRIIRKEQLFGQWQVRQIFLPSPHIFIANGIVNHNLKNIEVV